MSSLATIRLQKLLTTSITPSSSSAPLRSLAVIKTPSSRSRSIFTSTPALLRSNLVPLRSSSTFFSATSSTMGDVVLDSGMDDVQRRLMFEDECILVDENDRVVGHDTKYNCHLMEKIESENLLHRAFSVFLFNSKHELLLQPKWKAVHLVRVFNAYVLSNYCILPESLRMISKETNSAHEYEAFSTDVDQISLRCNVDGVQRSATKVTFPLVWTNTCCSHPLHRESELIEENALGARNAAQRKLLDELGIPAEEVPVDQFIPLGRMLYKAPSDGKWGEHELDYLLFIVRDVNMHPNPDEVAGVKYVNREELKELCRKADAGEGGLKLSPWFRLVVDNFLFKWWDHVEKGNLKEAADMKTIHKLT